MKVFISKRAQREVARIHEQWTCTAEHPDVFAREFLEWVDKLGTINGIGSPWPTKRRPGLKRVQLPKSQVHLYFERYEDEVRILCAWWARRRRPPKL